MALNIVFLNPFGRTCLPPYFDGALPTVSVSGEIQTKLYRLCRLVCSFTVGADTHAKLVTTGQKVSLSVLNSQNKWHQGRLVTHTQACHHSNIV